ncbi:MAG: ATP-binding protein, partial [Actinobacteria bacterium]|nr:ATP-binding protein [Actinomycetota bacterium]
GTIELAIRNLFFFLVGILVNRFVTETRRQSEQLRETHLRLQQAEAEARRSERLAALGQLTAGLAHELRNPLGVIKASVQMLEQEMDSGCGDAELTHVMVQEIDRLDSVVNALLDFGRPSESQFGTVDTARVMGEVVLLTKQFARQQGVEVKNDLPAGLPQIWADEDRLKQIFVNLISNAIQAMPDGGSLTMDGIARDGYLRISFADSGIGMSPEEKERIFDPFHTTRAEGSGLGLSIVHRIIDAHQGFISVDSEPGKGSTFVVGLPLTRTAAETGDGAYA